MLAFKIATNTVFQRLFNSDIHFSANIAKDAKIGQHVKAGDTLLLIEAMKTFNEIKAPKSGVIKTILALNSQPVEYGDHLIIFE